MVEILQARAQGDLHHARRGLTLVGFAQSYGVGGGTATTSPMPGRISVSVPFNSSR